MFFKKSLWLIVLFANVIVISNAIAHSGHADKSGEPPAVVAKTYFSSIFDDVRNVYTEPASNPHQSVINELNNEYIDTFSGLLQLKYSDVLIPANGGLDIVAQRNYLGVQPNQFVDMTALQRSVNGLGWSLHFGKLVSPSLNSMSLCESPLTSPAVELQKAIDGMLSDLEAGASPSLTSLQSRILTVKKLLSQRVTYSDQIIKELERIAAWGVHDIEVSAH